METLWQYSLETETQQIVHTAYQIQNFFLKINGFIVLPFCFFNKLERKQNIVFFPEINLKKIPDFWQKVKKVNISYWPIYQDKDFIQKIASQLEKLNLKNPKFSNLKNLWSEAEKEVMQKIEEILGEKNLIKKIIIHPTYFGTTMSYSLTKKYPAVIEIYLRLDQDIYSIVKGIISSLLHQRISDKFAINFREKEFLIDWLVTESSLAKVLIKYQKKSMYVPTINMIDRKEYKKIEEESERFLEKLDLSIKMKNRFNAKNNKVFFGKREFVNLTWSQREVLISLIQNKGK